MKLLSSIAVVSAIREAAHDQYVLSNHVGEVSPVAAECTPVVNEIVRFFAERIIDKIDALEDCGAGEHISQQPQGEIPRFEEYMAKVNRVTPGTLETVEQKAWYKVGAQVGYNLLCAALGTSPLR